MDAKLANATALYMEGIRDGDARRAVEAYTGDRYIQHSTGVRDGVEGFVEFFEPFIARTPERDIRVIRSIVDGRYVFVHVFQSLNGGEAEWVTTDFFDTDEDDKIIEHWDVIAPYTARTPSGHTSIDGPTEITDLEATAANKAIVRNMIEDLLMPGGDVGAIARYIAPGYVQHTADLADGIQPFRALLETPNRPLGYREIVLLVGQGNFVATLSRITREDAEYAQVDVFRLEGGLIVEHWDNVEPVPPPEELVNSGKF